MIFTTAERFRDLSRAERNPYWQEVAWGVTELAAGPLPEDDLPAETMAAINCRLDDRDRAQARREWLRYDMDERFDSETDGADE